MFNGFEGIPLQYLNRMAYDEEDIKNLKSELEKLIVCLDNITANEAMQNLESRFQRLESENSNYKADISRISNELLEVNLKLEVAESRVEKLQQENDNLVGCNKQLETRVTELEELTSYQTDKIKALRSVALALESENELISKEKGRPLRGQDELSQNATNLLSKICELETELLAKEEERKGFIECFEVLEVERKSLTERCSNLEDRLITKSQECDQYKTSLQLNTDTLEALRQSKRLIETKFQNAVVDNEQMSAKMETLNARIKSLEIDLESKSVSFDSLQHDLEVKTTVYETTIREIQSELDKLFEEVSASKDEDAEFIRKTYVKLFDEKAQELNKLERDFNECKKKLEIADRKILDAEYREHELETLLRKKESFILSGQKYQSEVEEIANYTLQLETQLNHLRNQYSQLCMSYQSAVKSFKEVEENHQNVTIQSLPADLSREIKKDVNHNSNVSQSKSKKKRKGKKHNPQYNRIH